LGAVLLSAYGGQARKEVRTGSGHKFPGRFAEDITPRNYEIYPDSSLIIE
jgi:hypothetical protein